MAHACINMNDSGNISRKSRLRLALLLAAVLAVVLTLSSCGRDGLSAYELAVKNGLTGVGEAQWVESLKGADGHDGKDGASAYELACQAGFQGTVEEWLASLSGKDGKDGQNGKSAYQSAVENGYTGSEAEWVAELMGTHQQAGTAGVGIASVQVNAERHLIVRLTNGTVMDAGYIGVTENTGANNGETGGNGEPGETDEDGYTVVNQIVSVTAGALNIRSAPNTTDSRIITYLTMGSELVRIGIGLDGNKWSKVLYNGQVCYASSAYLEVVSENGAVNLGNVDIPDVNLPDSCRLMVGQQMSFETGQFMEWPGEGVSVTFDYSGTGKKVVTADSIAITPTAAEKAELTVTLRKYIDGRPVVIYTKTVSLISEARENIIISALVIGDSRVSDGTLVNRLKSTWGASLTLIGTKKTAAGNAHEGRGAWSTSNYLSYASAVKQDNAFFNPKTSEFDFDYYLTANGFECPDLVVFYLGANDGYSALSVNNYSRLVESVTAAGKSRGKQVRVFIMTEYLAPADGFCLGYAFDAAFTRHAQAGYFERLTQAFGGREAEGIYIIPANLVINEQDDRVREEVRLSDYSDTGRLMITDVVHLSKTGYIKQADVISAYVNSIFSVK